MHCNIVVNIFQRSLHTPQSYTMRWDAMQFHDQPCFILFHTVIFKTHKRRLTSSYCGPINATTAASTDNNCWQWWPGSNSHNFHLCLGQVMPFWSPPPNHVSIGQEQMISNIWLLLGLTLAARLNLVKSNSKKKQEEQKTKALRDLWIAWNNERPTNKSGTHTGDGFNLIL